MSKDVKFHRYYVHPKNDKYGWGEFVIGDNGFVAFVSDYENGAYAWRHWGDKPFLEFFLQMVKDKYYFLEKLFPGQSNKSFKAKETCKEIREQILEAARSRTWDMEKAREEWELVEDYLQSGDLADVEEWYDLTSFSDPYEFLHYDYPASCHSLWDELIEPLAEAIEEELNTSESKND